MPSLADYERDRADTQGQLDLVVQQIAEDPGNSGLAELQSELSELIAVLDEEIAQLKPQSAPTPASKQPTPPREQTEKQQPQSGFKKLGAGTSVEDEAPINWKVNDTVLAKWSGDKGWYPARITSITGSSAAPIYVVKYKSYEGTETLRSKDIRPVSNKRKAEPTASSGAHGVAPTPPPPSGSGSFQPPPPAAPGVVTSANATVYPGAKRELEVLGEEGAKPPKAKKIKAKKELEANKNKWNAFQQSKHGKGKKDSMFRTPEGVHGRVGFTGSGQAMRADPSRSRHVYQMNEDLD